MRPKLMNAKKLPEMAQQQDSMAKPQTLEFVRAYYKITEPAVQNQIFELTKAAAKGYASCPTKRWCR